MIWWNTLLSDRRVKSQSERTRRRDHGNQPAQQVPIQAEDGGETTATNQHSKSQSRAKTAARPPQQPEGFQSRRPIVS